MGSSTKTSEAELSWAGISQDGSAAASRFAAASLARNLIARHSFSLWRRWALNSCALLLSDTLALGIALVLSLGNLSGLHPISRVIAIVPGWWLIAAAGNLLPSWGLSTCDHLRRQVSLLTGLFLLAAVALTPAATVGVPHARLLAAWSLSIILVPLGRMLTRGFLCRHKLHGALTVVFGRASFAGEVARRLRSDPGLGYVPVGLCTDDADASEDGDVPVIGSLAQPSPLAAVAIVVSRGLSPAANRRLIQWATATYRKLLIVPELGEIPSLWLSPRDLDGSVGLEISQTLLSPFATTVKRVVDLLLVVATAPIWGALCGLIALAIRLEDGRGALFVQKRAGRDGRVFHAYKFRTMVPNAEAVLQRQLEADPELRREWEQHFKLRRDPRITRVGRFLRRTSLDELPQLFNVLVGDMALVGPRPLPKYHLDRLPDAAQEVRARVRPGMTGLWQVSGRSDAGTEGMARWDPYYVRNWSIWLDIVILVRTVRVVMQGEGAR